MISTMGRLVALLALGLPVFAQQPWVVHPFQPPDGLPFEDVRDITETADGSLWFTSWGGGVARLRGTDWRVFTSEDGLVHDYVRSLAPAGDGGVWVATELGASHIGRDRIVTYDSRTLPFRDTNTQCVVRLANGHVWFGVDGGGIFACDDSGTDTDLPVEVAYTDEAGRRWYEVLPSGTGERESVWDVMEARDGAIWVATERTGLWVLRDGAWSHIPQEVLPCFRTRSLAQDESGRIWVAGSGADARLEDGMWQATVFDKDFLCIAAGPGGDVIGGTPWGLQHWDGAQWLPVQAPQTVGTPLIRVVRFLSDGQAWVGTKEGIVRLQRPTWQWVSHSGPGLTDGHAFYADPEVAPLAVNSLNQVVQYRDGHWQSLIQLPGLPSAFQSMSRPKDGVFHVIDGDHVHVCDLTAEAVRDTILLPDMRPLGVLQTRTGELFVYGTRGAFRREGSEWVRYPVSRPEEEVRSLFETAAGDILACHPSVVELWRDGEVALQLGPNEVPVFHGLAGAVERSTGEYWMGTRGLFIYNPESAAIVTTRQGLVSDRLVGFYESVDGTMWVGSEHKGVSSYRDDRWVSFSHADGLPNDRIVAIGEYPAGTMWIATRFYGLYRYYPAGGAPDTQITAGPETIDHNGTGVFSFRGYDAWNTTQEKDLEYSWRIVSLDDGDPAVDWRPFSPVHTVATPPLSPGRYVFEVRAADKDRDVDATPARVELAVLSPLYARPEFYVPVAALLGLALALGYGIFGKARALRESEKSYRSIVNGVSDAIVVRDLGTGAIVDANEQLTELFGLRRCDIVQPAGGGQPGGVPYVDRRAYADVLERARTKPQMTELFALRRDGTSFLTEVTLQRVAIGGRDCLLETVRDVSERQATEEKMRRLAMAVEQAGELILITDVEGVIQYVNPAFERCTGYTRDEAIGQTPRILKSGRHPAAFYDRMWHIISQGRVWTGRSTNKKKDGTLYEQESTISPVRDRDDGHIINYVAVARDVTREVRMEARLRQSQKLEAIGTLAGGIAHDFNNILSPILGFSELVRDQMPAESEMRDNVDEVIRAASRAKDLVHQILTFSRQAEAEQTPVRMGAVVREALRLLRATIPPTIEISGHIDDETGIVLADSTLLHQVVMNLCTNAYHAMEVSGGQLEVSLTAEQIPADLAAGHPRLKTGATYACLSVRDTGHGMDAATLERIFDPFFTTKEMGKGTGLGLATVHGIVMNLGGDIVVRSEVGKGTTFQVYIPQAQESAVAGKAVADEVPRGRGERLLLVDDEQAILEFSRQMLTRLGYQVTAMSSSKSALAAFCECPGNFDLIITDHAMPDMTGAQLAAEVTARHPGTPVVLITGFSEFVDADSAAQWGFAAFVQKPFTRATMAKVLRSILEPAQPGIR